MTYRVLIERRAIKALARIDPHQRDRISFAIAALGDDPRPPSAKKLSGRDGWRIRVGDYRVIYEIEDNQLIVLVVDLGHRQGIYSGQ